MYPRRSCTQSRPGVDSARSHIVTEKRKRPCKISGISMPVRKLGYASRTLFTNDERSVIFAQRPVILVGIDDFVKRGDLRDRSVFLNLAPIQRKGRRSERS